MGVSSSTFGISTTLKQQSNQSLVKKSKQTLRVICRISFISYLDRIQETKCMRTSSLTSSRWDGWWATCSCRQACRAPGNSGQLLWQCPPEATVRPGRNARGPTPITVFLYWSSVSSDTFFRRKIRWKALQSTLPETTLRTFSMHPDRFDWGAKSRLHSWRGRPGKQIGKHL